MRRRVLIALLAAVLAISAVAVVGGRSTPMTTARATTAAPPSATKATFSTPGQGPALGAAPGGDIDAVLATLDTVGTGPELEDATSAAFFAVLRELKRNPSLASQVEAMLAHAERSDPKTHLLVGALVGADTPESEAAVVRLFQTRAGDSDFLKLLVPTAGFEPAPGPELVRSVQGVAGKASTPELQHMADLAVGNMADQLQRSNPAESRRIVADYSARLEAATTPEDARANLAALGNAATPESIAVVQRHLDDPRPLVRAEAIEALRLVPTDDAEASLLRALREDADEDVRSRAAWTLSRRSRSERALETQIAALAAETSEQVGRALIESLLTALSTNRETVLAALTRTAASHPVAAIQEQARSALTQLSAS